MLIVLLSTVFAVSLCAQSLGSNVDTSKTRATIWLQNGEGKMIIRSGDTIPREFFYVKWVAVKSSRPIENTDHLAIIIQPQKGMGSAHFCMNRVLSPEVLTMIKTPVSDTKITFCITNKPFAKPSSRFYPLQVFLR